jgi:hypothetical protein
VLVTGLLRVSGRGAHSHMVVGFPSRGPDLLPRAHPLGDPGPVGPGDLRGRADRGHDGVFERPIASTPCVINERVDNTLKMVAGSIA